MGVSVVAVCIRLRIVGRDAPAASRGRACLGARLQRSALSLAKYQTVRPLDANLSEAFCSLPMNFSGRLSSTRGAKNDQCSQGSERAGRIIAILFNAGFRLSRLVANRDSFGGGGVASLLGRRQRFRSLGSGMSSTPLIPDASENAAIGSPTATISILESAMDFWSRFRLGQNDAPDNDRTEWATFRSWRSLQASVRRQGRSIERGVGALGDFGR